MTTAQADDPYPYQYNQLKKANQAAVNGTTYYPSTRYNPQPKPDTVIVYDTDIIDENATELPANTTYTDSVTETYRLDGNVEVLTNDNE